MLKAYGASFAELVLDFVFTTIKHRTCIFIESNFLTRVNYEPTFDILFVIFNLSISSDMQKLQAIDGKRQLYIGPHSLNSCSIVFAPSKVNEDRCTISLFRTPTF